MMTTNAEQLGDFECKIGPKHSQSPNVRRTIDLFEALADATWQRLRFAGLLRCAQGEETISDINLLELMRAQLSNIRIAKSDKQIEGQTGLDWEWWIGSDDRGWWRYAVQAKKLSSDQKYGSIRHKVGHHYQIDLLEMYSRTNNCIPLYCFYNSIADEASDLSAYWHCERPYDKTQLGCTLAPIDVVRKAFNMRGHKTFKFIHGHKSVIPWRCLIDCQHVMNGLSHLMNAFNSHQYTTLPTFLQPEYSVAGIIDTGREFGNAMSDFYSAEVRLLNSTVLPKRILVIDIG